jgi:superfamily II DNA or RNA helicase
MRFTAGDRVTVRGDRWVVEEATAYADATLLHLSSVSLSRPRRCTLLVPFDRPVAGHRPPTVRAVSSRRWAHYLRAHLSERRIHGHLRAIEQAAIDILPFQLEPALALIQGRGSRFLLADEVGLGKTVQAALMLAELRQRGWCDRALIVTPSGLRQQWADELRHRFDLQSIVVDAVSLSTLAATLPFDVNPWGIEPVVITSLDFVKQPEVLRAVAGEVWDLVIVDEAHQAAAAPQRHEAVQTIASRARHLVLVTATPHAGDDHAYRALCALGQLRGPEPVLLFRRTREQAGLPRTRRAHLLAVRPAPHAVEMYRLLHEYLSRLWHIAHDTGRRDAQLVAMVLAKRAFSSAHSLARSLERRMSGLTDQGDTPAQSLLPFDSDIDDSDEPVLPEKAAFERIDDERAVLKRLIDSANRARGSDRKMHAIRRILRRVAEPVIVFTEYRDTLEAIADAAGTLRRIAMVHGSQTAVERRDAIAAFTSGAANLLLATDAGSEGLNLHSTCRLVVNLELPWNPIRLEQRIGRVDRIGQQRTVHAVNLFAAGTAESDVLARLQRRLTRIHMSEIELAACVINRIEPAPPRPATAEAHASTIDMRESAHHEACRIAEARAIGWKRIRVPDQTLPVTQMRARSGASAALGRSAIALVRVQLATAAGRLIEDTLLPIRVPFAASKPRLRRREVRATAEALLAVVRPDVIRRARDYAAGRQHQISSECAAWLARAAERERGIARQASSRLATLVQTGLFDSRVIRQQLDSRNRACAVQNESRARARLLEADSHVCLAHDPEIALLLITDDRAHCSDRFHAARRC